MRRFVTLAVLLFFTIPFGVSIAGCSKKAPTVFCNGTDSGIPVGQVTTITLSPELTGISLNFAQIGQVSAPTATDCKGTSESVAHYTYGTFLAGGIPDMTIADVNPATGSRLRWHVEPEHWRRHPGLHRLQSDEQERNGVCRRKRRRSKQQSAPHLMYIRS